MMKSPMPAPAPRPPKVSSLTRRNGDFDSARALAYALLDTPPLAFSTASSHSRLSRSAFRSGSCGALDGDIHDLVGVMMHSVQMSFTVMPRVCSCNLWVQSIHTGSMLQSMSIAAVDVQVHVFTFTATSSLSL